MDRAQHLKVADFAYLGRIKGSFTYRSLIKYILAVKSEVKDAKFSSKAYGTRESKNVVMDGRLQLDMLQVMQRDYKLRSYSLNSVCAHFLGK